MSTASVPVPESVQAVPPGAPPARRHLFALPHFRNLWLGSTISLLGDQFYLVALPWLVLQITGSSLALGTMMMTAAIPRAALMLVGGAVTDRLSPRRVLMATAAVRSLLVGAVAALVWLGVIQLWQLYLLALAFGVADAFSLPAGPAMMPTLVPREQFPAANSLLQSSMVMTQMVGPAPAGLAIRRWGIAPALFFDALSFLGVIAALLRIPPSPPPPTPAAGAPARPSMLSSIGEGLRAVRQDKPLLALIVVTAAINFCIAGPVAIGLASLAKFRFGSPAAFGTLLSCFSGGTLVGLLLAGFVKRPRRRGLQLTVICTLAGLELVGIGLVAKLVAVGALLALMGVGVGFVNVQFSAWLQMRVDRALLGRVASVLMVSSVGLAPVSYALAGVLAQWSLQGLFLIAGGFLAVLSGALTLGSKAVRGID